MTLCFSTKTIYLEKLGEFLKSLCPTHPKLVAIELAVTEIVVNVIKHSGASFCKVSVCSEKLNQTLNNQKSSTIPNKEVLCEVIVEDNGTAFNPLQFSLLALGELRKGGYGLAIVQQVTDDLSYEREDNNNKLILRFNNTASIGA